MAKIGDKRPPLERFRSLFQGAARQTRPFVPALRLELLLLELIWEMKPHLSLSSHLSLCRTCSLCRQMTHVSMEYLLIRKLALEQHGCDFFERDAYAALVEIDRASETFVFLGGLERDGRLDPSKAA